MQTQTWACKLSILPLLTRFFLQKILLRPRKQRKGNSCLLSANSGQQNVSSSILLSKHLKAIGVETKFHSFVPVFCKLKQTRSLLSRLIVHLITNVSDSGGEISEQVEYKPQVKLTSHSTFELQLSNLSFWSWKNLFLSEIFS